MMPKMPAMLVTLDTLFPATRAPSLNRISPLGRSIVRAGALGEDGEVKMYESEATWTFISLNGRAMLGNRGSRQTARSSQVNKVFASRGPGYGWQLSSGVSVQGMRDESSGDEQGKGG
jgi:hypothetical protein